MFQVSIDKPKNLLKMAFIQHVTLEETRRWREQLAGLLGELQTGYKLLSDLSELAVMDPDCAAEIEFGMDLCNKAGVSMVVRVIPDPRKDIGLTIMSAFHYRRGVRIVTCETLEEALRALED
jgi:anti-anti-sigma regulatory factor